MAKLASDWAQKWLITLLILCCTLAAVIFGGVYWYFTSEHYWGKEYSKVYHSKYATDEEKELLLDHAYAVGVLPKEYYSNPDYVKSKIKQNQQVIKERRKQANSNKGKYSTKIPLER